ncbi:MAG: methyl-accepting chemotaxis protein [Clostridiaceae bacterium]|nr:methyl-accepting chemotaxis protein [Clostridiaceae bacterium]
MKSIKTKLVVYFSVLVLLISVVFGFVSLRTTERAVIKEVEQGLGLLAEEGSRLISTRLEVDYVHLEGIAARERISDPEIPLEIKMSILQDEVKKSGDYLRIGVSDMQGNLYLSDSYGDRGEIVDITQREYFHASLAGNRGLLPPAISVNADDQGSLIIVYSVPLYHNNSIVGILVAVADANFLSNLSDDMGFGDKGYAYMMNSEGTVIAHPNRDRVVNQFNPMKEAKDDVALKSLAEEFEKILTEKNGVANYYFEGDHVYVGHAPIGGTDWLIVITANEEEALSAIPVLARNIMLVTVIIFVLSILSCYLIGGSITKPIILTAKHAERIADLNITEDISKVLLERKDEIGSLSMAFQNITENLRDFIKQVVDTSQQVASSSEELTATSQQSATAADEVAKTIEEIARGANDQAQDTSKGAIHINELGGLIEKNQKYVRDLNTSTDEVSKLKDEGLDILKDLVEKTNGNNKSSKEIHEIIVNTNESAGKIQGASQMIKSIAEQTNLLALNAAIEAARAGEAGRGFAVVAEEIRKLAEQSNQFTEEIATIIQDLTDKTEHAVSTMERVGEVVASQTESVKKTNVKFEGIHNAIEKMKEVIVSINLSGKDMENKKDEIITILESLSAISQENAAGTEEASASVEEQTASMEEIADASESLARLAEDMQESISKFKY